MGQGSGYGTVAYGDFAGATAPPTPPIPISGYGTVAYGDFAGATAPPTPPIPTSSPGRGGYGTVPYADGMFSGGFPSAIPIPPPVVPYVAQPPFSYTPIFECPQVRDRPPYLPDSTQAEYRLWRHFENRLRGVNVWQRSDGTFCVDTPVNFEAAQTHPALFLSDDPIGPDETDTFQGLSDSNVNYPWNPIPPQPPFYDSTISEIPGAYVYITNWDGSTQTEVLYPYLVSWWEGGAVNPITQEEALVLTEAGFGDNIY